MTTYGKVTHNLMFDTGYGHRLDLDLIVDVDTNYVQYHVSGHVPITGADLTIDKYFGEFWRAKEEYEAIRGSIRR